MLQLSADVVRLIGEYIPEYQRSLRMTCWRMRDILTAETLPPISADIIPLCNAGSLAVLQLYPTKWLKQSEQFELIPGVIAAEHGYLEMFQWFHQLKMKATTHMLNLAAKRRHYELLRWAIDNDYMFTAKIYYYLAKHNNITLLKYLWSRDNSKQRNLFREQSDLEDPECEDPENSERDQLEDRKLELPDLNAKIFSLPRANLDIFELDSVLTGAALGGHLQIFQELRSLIAPSQGVRGSLSPSQGVRGSLSPFDGEPGLEWNNTWLNLAVQKGHFGLVKWLHQEGCPFDMSTFQWAIESDNFELMIWLKSAGCQLSEQVAYCAVSTGKLETLKWLIDNGCPIDQEVVDASAAAGRIEILAWLQEQAFPSCKFTCETIKRAAERGQLKCLQWLREQGCPWDETLCRRAVWYDQLEILKWVKANGCPWNRQQLFQYTNQFPEIHNWIMTQPD